MFSRDRVSNPIEIAAEVRRDLKPGGRLVVSFSDHGWPTKVIYRWTHWHAFERTGLVLEYLRGAGGFCDRGRENLQHWPPPIDDPLAIF